MLFFAEFMLNLMKLLSFVLIVVAVFVVIPAMWNLAMDEMHEREEAQGGRHRPCATSNTLAAEFLAQRRNRETGEYKILHPEIAGKRA